VKTEDQRPLLFTIMAFCLDPPFFLLGKGPVVVRKKILKVPRVSVFKFDSEKRGSVISVLGKGTAAEILNFESVRGALF